MIVALHGFLGSRSDWDFLRDAGLDVIAPPIDRIPHAGETLLGYSLGGRLALHALLAGAAYQRAIIVSAGLGVESEDERHARRAADEQWARRFESEEWDPLIEAWNAQPLFGGRAMRRDERQFDRAELARQIREWSPAVLPAIAHRLHEIDIPVLWIAGEHDTKYVAEANRAVELLPRAALWVCRGAWHRVPWERPDDFVGRVKEFIRS